MDQDFHRVSELHERYVNGHGPEQMRWKGEVRQMRDYVQRLGLRYAELAAAGSRAAPSI